MSGPRDVSLISNAANATTGAVSTNKHTVIGYSIPRRIHAYQLCSAWRRYTSGSDSGCGFVGPRRLRAVSWATGIHQSLSYNGVGHRRVWSFGCVYFEPARLRTGEANRLSRPREAEAAGHEKDPERDPPPSVQCLSEAHEPGRVCKAPDCPQMRVAGNPVLAKFHRYSTHTELARGLEPPLVFENGVSRTWHRVLPELNIELHRLFL